MSVAMYLKICSIFYMHRLTRLHSPRIFSLTYNKSFQIVTLLKRFVYLCLFDEFLRFCKYVLNSCLFWLKNIFLTCNVMNRVLFGVELSYFDERGFIYHIACIIPINYIHVNVYYMQFWHIIFKKNWKSKQFWLNIRRTPETYFLRVFKILHSISNTTEYSH